MDSTNLKHYPTWFGGGAHDATSSATPASAAPTTGTPSVSLPDSLHNQESMANRNNTVRARFVRTFKPNKNYNEPALRLKGPWVPGSTETPPPMTGKGKEEASETTAPATLEASGAYQLSQYFFVSEKRHADKPLMDVGASRKAALSWERTHLSEIPNDQRIFPDLHEGADHLGWFTRVIKPLLTEDALQKKKDTSHKKNYHEQILFTSLQMMGENDFESFRNSLRNATPGAAHRHGPTSLNLAANWLGAIQAGVGPAAPIAGVILTPIRYALITTSAIIALLSGEQKTANAVTEETHVNARFDDAPRAKEAADMLTAAKEVFTELWAINKALTKLDAAEAAKNAAKAKFDANPEFEGEYKAAASKWRHERAKLAFKIEVKSQYKTASETMKVEFSGSKRHLYMSLANAGITGVAGGLGVMTFLLGNPVTAAIGGAAAAVGTGLYCKYLFSNDPDKDNEGKGSRAAIALEKSSDLLNDKRVDIHKERAVLCAKYMAANARIRKPPLPGSNAMKHALNEFDSELGEKYKFSNDTLLSKKDALKILDDEYDAALIKLDEQEMELPTAVTPEQNHAEYRAYEEKLRGLSTPEEKEKAAKEYAVQVKDRHNTDIFSKAAKDPVSMRMDLGRKLLVGKMGQAKKDWIDLNKARSLKEFLHLGISPEEKTLRQEEIRTNLAQNFADALNLEAGTNTIKHMVKQNDDADLPNGLKESTRFFASLADEDFLTLFKGDGEAQNIAGKKAKKKTIGDADKYKWSAIGGLMLGVAAVEAVGITDIGMAAAKFDGLPVPYAPDYKIITAAYTPGQSAGGPYIAGARHRMPLDAKELQRKVQKGAKKASEKGGNSTEDATDTALTTIPEEAGNTAETEGTPSTPETKAPPKQLTFTLDWPHSGVFRPEDMAEIVNAYLDHQHLPEHITIEFRSDPGLEAAGHTPPLKKIDFNLASTVPFRKVLIKEAGFKDGMGIKWQKSKIIGRQMLTIGAPLLQAAAQAPLRLNLPFNISSRVPLETMIQKLNNGIAGPSTDLPKTEETTTSVFEPRMLDDDDEKDAVPMSFEELLEKLAHSATSEPEPIHVEPNSEHPSSSKSTTTPMQIVATNSSDTVMSSLEDLIQKEPSGSRLAVASSSGRTKVGDKKTPTSLEDLSSLEDLLSPSGLSSGKPVSRTNKQSAFASSSATTSSAKEKEKSEAEKMAALLAEIPAPPTDLPTSSVTKQQTVEEKKTAIADEA